MKQLLYIVSLFLPTCVSAQCHETGWVFFIDNEYTSTSPLFVAGGQEIDLPNNAAFIIDDEAPCSGGGWIVNNQFVPTNLNDVYNLTIYFTARFTDASSQVKIRTYIDDSGPNPLIIENYVLRRTDVNFQDFQEDGKLFSGANLVSNNGRFKFYSDRNVEIYDIRYFIHQTFNSNESPPIGIEAAEVNKRTRIINLEASQNLNISTSVPTYIDWTSAVPVSPANPNEFNVMVTDEDVEITEPGTYFFELNLSVINVSTNSRRSIYCGIYKNQVLQGNSMDIYIRGSSADNIGGGQLRREIDVVTGDKIRCGCLRDATSGTMNTNGIGGAELLIYKSKY